MRHSWQQRIDRASELAARDHTARPLLDVYRRLLILQRDCHASLETHAHALTGSLEQDLPSVRACACRIPDEVAAFGPPPVVEQARELADGGQRVIDSMLLEGWRTPSDGRFLAKVVLQPYATCLAAYGIRPIDRQLPPRHTACPFCGGAPQVSVLHHAMEADGGGRDLVCGTCSTTWPFRRLLCAHCGEDAEGQLGYFHSGAYEHLRIDACETCKHYLKSVDLTRLGVAVPLVDELAAAPLDLWARERGYEKIELNLIGL